MNKGGLEALLGLVVILSILGSFLLDVLKVIGMVAGVLGATALVIFIIQCIIEGVYYNSKKFYILKEQLAENTIKFNELNEHIKELKTAYNFSSCDFGVSTYSDNSIYNFKRPYLDSIHNNTENEHFCSLSVCKNAQQQPFKYLCKYFYIPIEEDSLNVFEKMLNDFSAAEEGKQILLKEREDIKENHKKSIPLYIRLFRMKNFFQELGYTDIDVTDSHFPHYSFKYISAGGNSQMTCDINLDIANLERFVSYLYSQVQIKKTMKYQRALMTEKLRTTIKERDNYTCQKCGVSITQEPHLLLEIDHIIPISKNGKTTLDNLQTLCWKCNRAKSNKLN